MVLDWRTPCPGIYDFLGWVFHFINPYSDSHDRANTHPSATCAYAYSNFHGPAYFDPYVYAISDTHISSDFYDRANFDPYSYTISDTYAHAYP